MSDEAAFLRAIAESPDDDAPRLVFADWLDEHGDHARAEFIRSQVALAQLDEADPHYPATLARVRRSGMLTRPKAWPFIDHVPGGQVMFRRGLIAGVRTDASAHLTTSPGAWDGVPVEQLCLTGEINRPLSADFGSELAGRPELRRLETLALAGYGWRASDLQPLLVGCPNLAGLRAFRLENVDWRSAAELAEIVERMSLPSLESLFLGNFPNQWEVLVRSCPPTLRRLILQSHHDPSIPDEEWEAVRGWWLASTPCWPNLEHVSVEHDVDTMSGHIALRAGCPSWGPLDSLDVGQTWGGSGIMDTLASTPQARQLRQLRLGEWIRRDEAGRRPRWPGELAGLQHLSVGKVAMGRFPELLSCLPRTLLRLEIDEWLEPSDIAALAETPLPELRWLRFRNLSTDFDLTPFLWSTHLPNLCTLIHGDRTTLEVLRQLARAPGLPHLSLVGSNFHQGHRYVLADGEAHMVRPDVLPLECDWWRFAPDEDWQ